MTTLSATVFETAVAQPDEEFGITVDFFSRLIALEEVNSVVVTVFDKAGADVTGTILNGAAQIQTGRSPNSVVFQNVHNLVDGERYNVQILATTTAGTAQVLEADVYIPVKKLT